jgi:ATP-dependent phosphofructokinase / diphosphate-dependent phosphofructokinase
MPMASKKRNVIVGQSGGPTSVINSSLAGVYKNAIERGFDKVYGMLHGVQGLLDEQYVDMSTQIHSDLDIELLKRTPSAFLGSCRYKLPEIHENMAIYDRIFEILDKLEIDSFIYIGGNDSMDTIRKLSDYAIVKGHKQKFLGVPKTIDNDLALTDHTPGFGSAAKYIAASTKEVIRDALGLTYNGGRMKFFGGHHMQAFESVAHPVYNPQGHGSDAYKILCCFLKRSLNSLLFLYI